MMRWMMLRWMMLVALSLLVSFPSWSADFGKGLAAAERGDYATAIREWRPLAEQGDAKAQYNLGVMYKKGMGVAQDYGQAVKWYRRAAEQGYAEAQNNLGVMYGNGRGVVEDYVTAHMWGNIARANGNDSADELLDALEQLMSKGQIARAQQRASDCMANQYKNC
jgi:TPR repeat protein